MIPKWLLMMVATSILEACGSSSGGGNSGPGSGDPWSNTAMQQLVQNRCATSGCHSGSQRPNYSGITESSMKSDTAALRQIRSGTMPPGSPLSTAERASVEEFYK